MPKKGHRTASRQAQLRQKKRRGKSSPQVFNSGPAQPAPATATDEGAVESDSELDRREAAVATAAPPRDTAPPPQPARRSRQRTAAQSTPAVYRYLGAELRQIGIISTLIVAILVVLTVFLRG